MKPIYIFDIDNTLIDTRAQVKPIYPNGTTKYYNSTEFNAMDSYQLRRDNHKVTIDFSEFDSLEQLLKEPFIEKNWNLLKEVYSSGHIIFLLTSRYNPNEIFEWLCHNQMFIKKDKILTRLDHPQYKNTISKQFKKDMVFHILDTYGTSVVWVEDDISAIEGVVKDIRYGIYQNKLQIIL